MKIQMLIIVFLAGALFCKAQSIERDVVASIPNYDIVDWMLVELRDANNAPSATPATIIAQQAAFVLKDGSVVGMDGSSVLSFNQSVKTFWVGADLVWQSLRAFSDFRAGIACKPNPKIYN